MNEEHLEDILEHLWTVTEEGHAGDTRGAADVEALAELERRGLVAVERGRPALTLRGRTEAQSVLRRHRLAERLLQDVFDTPHAADTACRMEHLLSREVEAALCTLLGHPTECPHGHPIPAGDCCRERDTTVGRAVAPASELHPGEEGVVAYVRASGRGTVQKLLALGLLPGTRLRLVQRRPAFVLATEGAEVALDESVAREVYVRVRPGREGGGGKRSGAPAVPRWLHRAAGPAPKPR